MARNQIVTTQLAKSWHRQWLDGAPYTEIAKKYKYSPVCVSNHVRKLENGRKSTNSNERRTASGQTTIMATTKAATQVRRIAEMTGENQADVTEMLVTNGVEAYKNDIRSQLDELNS